MRLAIGFNPTFSAKDGAALARKAESAGFESIWMHESLFQRDLVTYLATMAGATQKMRLGSGVLNTFTRHPVAAAATFASLAELSDGRVNMGIGLGSFPTVPLIGQKIFPVEETRPLKRIKEYIAVVKAVWEGKKVDFEGDFFKVHNLQLGFELKQKVPIFVGSLSPKTLRFAGAEADGAILSPALNTVWGTSRMIGWVEGGEAAKGRKVERASYMLTSVDADPAKAKQAVRDFYFFVYQLADVVRPEVLEPYGIAPEKLAPMKEAWKKGDVPGAKKLIPDEAIEVLTVAGTPDHALDRISEYVKAGVTLPMIMPIGNVEHALQSLGTSGAHA